ncbi:chromatin/chromatin-binding, or -regulatory protein [Lithospermum erythrorhizon]|uniref:Chromatin/chromatin-binding, or -regulatory protein n=1 Tax=Lithospermum erythrorhizon TaxID=34254 RepID=A0AAV3RRE5_LITER
MAPQIVKAQSTPFKRQLGNVNSINKWAVQCRRCFKWRSIENQKQFEVIRCKFVEDPFYCEKKNGVSCDDPADLIYNASRTWVIDKPNLPRTPANFKRDLVLRRDHSKMDVYYVTPTGKRLRSITEAAQFLQENKDFSHLTLADFSFTSPKVMQDTVPDYVKRKGSSVNGRVLS